MPETIADDAALAELIADQPITDHGSTDLRAPFPWFGGKSRVAGLVWERFGAVVNYVEPFFGSGAVLLGRPLDGADGPPGSETVNDKDCMVANFWRALAADPAAVAAAADWPVNEADQHARHLWLVSQAEFRERMKTDPEFYDARIAGWWVWGQSIYIGAGWCASERPSRQLPHLGDAGHGVHRKLPHVGDAGRGVHRGGVHGEALAAYMAGLAARLRRVRVCCGDWTRVTGPSVTFKHGLTGVFLDPPYGKAEGRDPEFYAADDLEVAAKARDWALENGSNPLLRIALCGYEGGHDMPPDWQAVAWKARGGYGSQGNGTGRANASRERIWFSPHCLGARQRGLLFPDD